MNGTCNVGRAARSEPIQRMVVPPTPDYPQVPLWALLLFCGYVIVWYLQVGERVSALGAFRFEFIYAAVTALTAILLLGRLELGSPLNGHLVAYLFLLLIQIPLSLDFDTSWTVFVNRVFKFAFMGFFIIAFVRSPQGLRYFLGAFLLACMKIGQEGLVGKITGGMMWQNQGVMRLHGTTSLYAHPNSLSGNALGVVPFIYTLFPISSVMVKGGLAFLTLCAATIILYSGSRTAYVGLIVIVLVTVLKGKKRVRSAIIVLFLCLAAVPLLPQPYVERFNSIFTQREAEGESAAARKQILEDAWQILKEHPLGVGVAAFPKVRTERFGRSQDTHNLYLEVATNLGIQGFVVFVLLIYRTLRTLGSLQQDFTRQLDSVQLHTADPMTSQHCKDLKLLCATTTAVSLFIIVRLVIGLFGMDLYEIYWWFAIGLTIALWNINRYSRCITESILAMAMHDVRSRQCKRPSVSDC